LNSRAAFFIAVRYLLGRAREGGRYLRGAAAGIAVSLIPIIVTLIVADGMIRGIVDRYLELGTGHLQAFNFFSESDDMEATAEKIRGVEGVRGVWPEQRGMGVLVGKRGKTGASVRAIDPSFWEDGERYLKTLAGNSKPETGRDMLLGENLAGAIGAEVGDTVRLMTLRTADDGKSIPRMAAFTVRGVVSSGYHELDALWCIITTEGGARILSPDTSSSSVIVKMAGDPYRNADAMAWTLYNALGSGYGVYTWKELMRSQYSSYESTRQLLLFIMALVVIVAAVNVSSATSMLVIERQRDIAVLKVTGASVRGVAGIFLRGSFLTGLCGAVAGIALGLLIGNFINPLIRSLEKLLSFFSGLFNGGEVKILDPGFYLETIPIVIDWFAVFLIGCFTVLCSVLASWIPARRAGKLKPMDLLRKY
jgi:lipoprotein-releasing system permease protein